MRVNAVLPCDITPDTLLSLALDAYSKAVTPSKRGHDVERSRLRALGATFLSALPVRLVDRKAAARYRDELLAAGRAASTVRSSLSLLSVVFTWLSDECDVDVPNPVVRLRKPTVNNARTRRLEPAEKARLFGALIDTGNQAALACVRLLLATAVRRGELCALQWEDVDLTRRVALVRLGKNGHARTLPLSKEAVAALQALGVRARGPVVPMRPESLSQAVERACRRAGIVGLRLHDLRRSAVSELLERGLDVTTVASISGHRQIQVLWKHYAAIRAEGIVRQLDATER